MVLDSAYFNQNHLLFFNFTCTVIYPLFQAMSKPSKNVTKTVPNGNLFGPVNHFRFWGSLIIATGGLIAGYFYFRSTKDFYPNTNPSVIQKMEPTNPHCNLHVFTDFTTICNLFIIFLHRLTMETKDL